MGLSIHYKGSLKNATDLNSLIEEVKDVAMAEKWDYFVFEDQFENNAFSEIIDKENLFGIMVTPKDSEPFCFSFLSNGKMCGLLNFNVMKIDNKINENLLYSVSTKTQYAGYKAHKELIILLDYISKKYLFAFECNDESEYWETRNEELLIENFKRNANLIDNFKSSIEMIPINKDEKMDDYLIRLAQITNDKNAIKNEMNDDEEMPKLNIEQENEFKRIKLSLEHDAIFPEGMNSNLPPEIESMFLDNIMNFENSYKKGKQITVFEKIGKPKFISANELDENQITNELKKLITLLEEHNILFNVICNYEDEDRLLYTFLTEELFKIEIDEIDMPGMMCHFTYEDFHPNDEFEIENSCIEFIEMFLDKEDNLYLDFHSKDALNYIELNNFRNVFKKFKIKDYKYLSATIENENAKASFSIDFWGKIKGSDTKIYFTGEGDMTFKYEFGFWYVQTVNLPKME